jgi:hypothetical protein
LGFGKSGVWVGFSSSITGAGAISSEFSTSSIVA